MIVWAFAFALIGIVLEVVGACLIAWDVWHPPKYTAQLAADPFLPMKRLADALASTDELHRQRAAAEIGESLAAHELGAIAVSALASDDSRAVLVFTRWGLALVCLGFLFQFASTATQLAMTDAS